MKPNNYVKYMRVKQKFIMKMCNLYICGQV